MGTEAQHLMLATFEGHADLAIPTLGITSRHVPIRFHPQTLCVEAFLDRSDAVVDVLADERSSVVIHLDSVVLRTEDAKVQLRASDLRLYRSNPLHEWPECSGLLDCELTPEARSLRRLELKPSEQVLAFTADDMLSSKHPFQIYYGGALTGLRALLTLEHTAVVPSISFCSNYPQPGLLCAFSANDFFHLEPRISAAWSLIHGKVLTPVLEIKEREIHFYGQGTNGKPSYLPLVDNWGSSLPESVMSGFVNLEQERFDKANLALKFFLTGKQADVPLEARYMLLMTCVEAMDGTRQLKQACTAAMLGVSADAAFLFNGMRNQLVHGCGGYQHAFAAFLCEDLKDRPWELEPALQPCVRDRALDFIQLWFRLCERLDAFWCGYLNVPAALADTRYAPIKLMSAVNPETLDAANKQLPEEKQEASGALLQIEELRQANQRLGDQNAQLRQQLVAQGRRIVDHKKSQHP